MWPVGVVIRTLCRLTGSVRGVGLATVGRAGVGVDAEPLPGGVVLMVVAFQTGASLAWLQVSQSPCPLV